MVNEGRPLNRRRLLATLGASGVLAVAGCVGDDGGDDDDEPDYDVSEVCEEADTTDPEAVLPEGDGEWEETFTAGAGFDHIQEHEYHVYEHEDYDDTTGYAVYILDHELWDRDELLDAAELHGEHDDAITYAEIGDWVYMAMGPTHEGNRDLLEEFEYVSAECAQAATEIDPGDE